MELFVVFKEGVYRHECVGIMSALPAAKSLADAAKAREQDDYHEFVVVPFNLDMHTHFEAGFHGPTYREADVLYSTRGPRIEPTAESDRAAGAALIGLETAARIRACADDAALTALWDELCRAPASPERNDAARYFINNVPARIWEP